MNVETYTGPDSEQEETYTGKHNYMRLRNQQRSTRVLFRSASIIYISLNFKVKIFSEVRKVCLKVQRPIIIIK